MGRRNLQMDESQKPSWLGSVLCAMVWCGVIGWWWWYWYLRDWKLLSLFGLVWNHLRYSVVFL